MANHSKYTVEQRKIARKIGLLLRHQRLLRKKWLSDDVKIIAAKASLKGKYGKTN